MVTKLNFISYINNNLIIIISIISDKKLVNNKRHVMRVYRIFENIPGMRETQLQRSILL